MGWTEQRRGTLILAIANNKGGVGKTTTTVHLAAALSELGKKVLVIDVDGQASASMSLGLSRDQLFPSLSQVLFPADKPKERMPIEDVIRKDVIKNVDLVPADKDLYSFDVEYAATENLDFHDVLGRVIWPLRADYDIILLDTPPAFSLLTINALLAADRFLIPVTPDYLGAEGLQNLNEMLEDVREGVGKTAREMGILVTMTTKNTRFHAEIIDVLRKTFGDLVFDTVIYRTIRFQEAPNYKRTLFEWEPKSPGVAAYRAFAKEVLARTGLVEGKKTVAAPEEAALREVQV